MRMLDDLLASRVEGRRVLVRADLNVPLADGRVADDGRIRAAVPVLSKLLGHGARVVVAAHLGRPRRRSDQAYSLLPVAERLAQLLGNRVGFVPGTVDHAARQFAGDLVPGELLLLENVRFHPEETDADPGARRDFARRLAALTGGEDGGGAFVQDAFGALHRPHASVCEITGLLPSYCGDLVRDELAVLRALSGEVNRPYVVVLGGSKVSGKLAAIEALLPRVDKLLIGGGMCFTFMAAAGHQVGGSLVEADQLGPCRRWLAERAADGSAKIVLPSDIVVAPAAAQDARTRVVPADAIPPGQRGLDIGPRTVAAFAAELACAATVFWNGPMGVFELTPFAAGTRGVARAVAAVPGLSVVGGGDSAAAVRALGLDADAFGHISTGGGASLEFLQGKTLPGLAALRAALRRGGAQPPQRTHGHAGPQEAWHRGTSSIRREVSGHDGGRAGEPVITGVGGGDHQARQSRADGGGQPRRRVLDGHRAARAEPQPAAGQLVGMRVRFEPRHVIAGDDDSEADIGEEPGQQAGNPGAGPGCGHRHRDALMLQFTQQGVHARAGPGGAAADPGQEVIGLGPVQGRGQGLSLGLVVTLLSEVPGQTLAAAGGARQQAVLVHAPPVGQAMIAEGLVERRAVPVPFGLGQRAVHVEYHRAERGRRLVRHACAGP